MSVPSRHVFLSPHYDDVALSCGGSAARLVAGGAQAEIVVLFGGEPDAGPTTDLSERLHARWGLSRGEAVAVRREEEALAASILGATTVSLGFADAIYRGARYPDDARLFGPPAGDEADLPAALVDALQLRPGGAGGVRAYAPLAVGGHVDHRHGFAAGVLLLRRGWDVWFYEDLPYASREGALEQRLAEIAQGGVAVELAEAVDVEATWSAKIDAVLAYRSQLGVVFDAPNDEAPLVASRVLGSHARRVGDGRAVERFWRVGARRAPAS